MTDFTIVTEAVRLLENARNELYAETQNLKARIKSIELAYKMSEEELGAAKRVVEELRWAKEKAKEKLGDALTGVHQSWANERAEWNAERKELQEALERANANSAVFNMKQEQPHKHWPGPGEMDCYECIFFKNDAASQQAQPPTVVLGEGDEEAHPTPHDFVRAGYTADWQPHLGMWGCKTGTADCDVNPIRASGNTPMTREQIAEWDRRAAERLNAAFAKDSVPRGTSKDRQIDRPAIAYPSRVSPDPAIDTDKYSRDTWFIKK